MQAHTHSCQGGGIVCVLNYETLLPPQVDVSCDAGGNLDLRGNSERTIKNLSWELDLVAKALDQGSDQHHFSPGLPFMSRTCLGMSPPDSDFPHL